VTNVPYASQALRNLLKKTWKSGRPKRFGGPNVYGGTGCGRRIARILAGLSTSPDFFRKLIAY
jgi:hypothetical protein